KSPFVMVAAGGEVIQTTFEFVNAKRRRSDARSVARVAAEVKIRGESVHVVVVEDVKALGAELHTHPLSDFELLRYRRIQVPCARPPERVPADHTRRKRSQIA